ncbi:MAG: Sapep family Mn(2+)-dependent dipeptidase [Roseburia sp.]|nr:Sapep family Mn(2+)-dependent dipeptidase [Roseburia sp.]
MDEMFTRRVLDDLAEIVAIPSVYSQPTDGAPYGAECLRAIEWFVNKARSYGLKAESIDGACAYAEVGAGKECIGILGHLDVVPAGNGWSADPFKMTEENGKVYGRGVGDDKGAVVVCLHALKTLADNNVKLKRRVRLIVGADEERGSSCIRRYLASGGEVPVMSFVPDSEFPVINSEKGILHLDLHFADGALAENISYIDGAECYNAVPDRSSVKIIPNSKLEKAIKALCGGSPTDELFKKAPLAERIVSAGNAFSDYEIRNADCMTVTANGVAEHASTPEKGDNALWKTLGFLAAFGAEIGSEYVGGIYDFLCTPLASEKLGIYVDDPKSGDLTMCMAQARLDGGELVLTIDFRLPLGVTPEFVVEKIEAAVGCKAEIRDYHKNLYIDEEAPLIKTLLGVYRRLTGDMTAPLKVGGGTYARELPNAVAFGCTPVDIDINMHKADENFPVAQLFKNYEIYYAAAVELANM